MTNYRIIEDRAYELAEDTDLTADEIADRLIEIYGIGADEAQEIADCAVEDIRCEDEPDWDREMGFDPYEGCYNWDC